MFSFERLDVWQKSIEFADLVYECTRTFPDPEKFGLRTQMRRAAVSVASNIAEGSSRFSKADFVRFIEIATGSLFEVISQAFISRRQAFLDEDRFLALYAAAEEQGMAIKFVYRLGDPQEEIAAAVGHMMTDSLGPRLYAKLMEHAHKRRS